MKFTEDELEIIEDALIDWVGSMPTGIALRYHDKCALLRDKVRNRKKDLE